MSKKPNKKAAAEKQRRMGAVRDRFAAVLNVSPADYRTLQMQGGGSLVIHDGVWLSLAAAERLLERLENGCAEGAK